MCHPTCETTGWGSLFAGIRFKPRLHSSETSAHASRLSCQHARSCFQQVRITVGIHVGSSGSYLWCGASAELISRTFFFRNASPILFTLACVTWRGIQCMHWADRMAERYAHSPLSCLAWVWILTQLENAIPMFHRQGDSSMRAPSLRWTLNGETHRPAFSGGR